MGKKDYAIPHIKYFTKNKLITTVINIAFKNIYVQLYLHQSPLKEKPPEGNGLEPSLVKLEDPLVYRR